MNNSSDHVSKQINIDSEKGDDIRALKNKARVYMD